MDATPGEEEGWSVLDEEKIAARIWRAGAFAGEFGDAYIKDTALEGGRVEPAIDVLTGVIREVVATRAAADMPKMVEEGALPMLEQICVELEDAAACGRRDAGCRSGSHAFVTAVCAWMERLRGLLPGERFLSIGGWTRRQGGHALMMLLERAADGASYSIAIINSGNGVDYHPSTADAYPKTRYRCAVRVANIPPARFLEEAAWHVMLRVRLLRDDVHGPEVLYHALLPHLAGDRPLSTAIEECDPGEGNGTNGDWESPQLAGTCYYRCVLLSCKYLLHRAGISRPARKQFTLAVRLGYLDRCLAQLGTPDDDFQDSDLRMVTLAAGQAARAAVKAQQSENISETSLRGVYELVAAVRAAAAAKPIADRESTASMSLQAPTSTDETQTAQLRAFRGFDRLVEDGDTTMFAGDITDASPDMFVDLLDPPGQARKPRAWTLKAIFAQLTLCRERCDRLLRKTSASAVSVALYQLRALVEDVFSDVLPVPQPRPPPATLASEDFATSCPYLSAGRNGTHTHAVTPAEQRDALKNLRLIAKFYFSASMSVAVDRNADSLRHVTLGAVLAVADAIARVPCATRADRSDVSGLTQTLLGSEGEDDDGYWPALRSFSLRETRTVAAAHVLHDPRAVTTRDLVLGYLCHSAASRATKVLDWEPRSNGGFGQSANFEVEYDEMTVRDDTLGFVARILRAVGAEKQLPRSESTGRGAARMGTGDPEHMCDAERYTRWVCDGEWHPCPEFAAYRDLIFYYRLSMESTAGLLAKNYHFHALMTPDKVDPVWQFWEAQANQKGASLRLNIADIRRNTNFASAPPTPVIDLTRYITRGTGGARESTTAPASVPTSEGPPAHLKEALFGILRKHLLELLVDEVEEVNAASDEALVDLLLDHKLAPPEVIAFLRALAAGTLDLGQPGVPPAPTTESGGPLVTEEDVLHTEGLPRFKDVLSGEESERLLTYLTVPYMAIPLVLAFFAEERAGALINDDLRSILEFCLFETRVHAHVPGLTDLVPQPPMDRDAALATRFGVLTEELVTSPTAVLAPLLKIARSVGELCVGDFASKFSKLLLLFVRVLCRVEAIFSYLEERPETKFQLLDAALAVDESYKGLQTACIKLRQDIQDWLRGVAYPMVLNWLRQSEAAGDIGASTGLHAHLALLVAPALTAAHLTRNRETFSRDASAFLCSTAFVVSWQTKKPKGAAAAAAVPRRMYRGFGQKRTQPPPPPEPLASLLDTPVAEVFSAMQQRRAVVLRWADEEHRSERDTLDTALGRMVATALQREVPATLALAAATPTEPEESAWKGWRSVDEKPLMCEMTLESPHPYLPGTDSIETVCFPGARYILVNFDSRSSTEERGGEVHDYVTVYRDASLTRHWGDLKRIGGSPEGGRWPGMNGMPPLIVPADHFVVAFHSDQSIEDWGFKLTAFAPVDVDRARALMPIAARLGVAPASPEDRLLLCQRALAACANDLADFPGHRRALPPPAMAAEAYLESQGMAMAETLRIEQAERGRVGQAGEKDEKPISGLFQDPAGGVQANLQTAEVYLQNRMLMPTPTDIASHDDFRALFPMETPFCAVVEGRTDRRIISIVEDQRSYTVESWTPLRHEEGSHVGGLDGAAISRETADLEVPEPVRLGLRGPAGSCGGLPDQDCHGLPKRPPPGGSGLVYAGKAFSRQYNPGLFEQTRLAWASELLDPLLARTTKLADLDEPPTIWLPDAVNVALAEDGDGLEALVLLMYVPPSGAAEERKGHPGGFYELAFAEGAHRNVQVFYLGENARHAQRQCVYASDARASLEALPIDAAPRREPWPRGTRHAGGCMWAPIMDSRGQLTKLPGAGDLVDAKVGSLRILRNRRVTVGEQLADLRRRLESQALETEEQQEADSTESPGLAEDDTEAFVPARFLQGVLPSALLKRYEFWRTGSRTLRGYPTDAEDETAIYAVVDPSGRGMVKRLYSPPVFPPLLEALEKEAEVTPGALRAWAALPPTRTLLDITQAPDGSALAHIGAVAMRLDHLSHVLCWSSSDAAGPGDECEIALLELERLRLRFEARRSGPGGRLRLHSLDHAGLFVAEDVDESAPVMKLCHGFQEGVLLNNALEETFFLLPNYALRRVEIAQCPLNGEVVAVRTPQDWLNFVQTTHYLYRAHISGAYLSAPTLSASLYLTVYRLLQREYVDACRVLATCFTDVALNGEETWVLSQVTPAADDAHPDAVATRLKIALTAQFQAVDWDLSRDLAAYHAKQRHVHAVCRLTLEEERELLSRFPTDSRRRYLNAVEAAGAPGGDAMDIPSPGCPSSVGGSYFAEVSRHLVGNNLSAADFSVPSYSLRYTPPDKALVTGDEAVSLVTSLLDDSLAGKTSGTGFCLLYDMAVGRIRVQVEESLRDAEPPSRYDYVRTIPRGARDVAAEEAAAEPGPRRGFSLFGRRQSVDNSALLPTTLDYDGFLEAPRGTETSASLARLLASLLLLKLTNNGKNPRLATQPAYFLSILFPMCHSVLNSASLAPPPLPAPGAAPAIATPAALESDDLPEHVSEKLVDEFGFGLDTAQRAWKLAGTALEPDESRFDATIRLLADDLVPDTDEELAATSATNGGAQEADAAESAERQAEAEAAEASGAGLWPALPFSVCEDALKDGTKMTGPLRMFFVWAAYQARCYTTGSGPAPQAAPAWRDYHVMYPARPSTHPSVFTVPKGASLHARPFFTDFSCGLRKLASSAAPAALRLSAPELEAFADQPLAPAFFYAGLREHIEYGESHDGGPNVLGDLPFNVGEVPGMATPAARSVQDRIRGDLARSAEALRIEKVPQMKYLNEGHLQAIERDLGELQARAGDILASLASVEAEHGAADEEDDEDDLDAPPPAVPALGRTPSTAEILRMAPPTLHLTTSYSRTISAASSEILVNAMTHLDGLLDGLERLGATERQMIADGVQELEDMANALHFQPGEAPRSISEQISHAGLGEVAFELRRLSGDRCRAWLSMLASLPLHAAAEDQLRGLNPFLTEASAGAVVDGLQVLQLRCVRLAQLSQCRKGIFDLKGSILQLLGKRLEAEWADVFIAENVPLDPGLVRRAMLAGDHLDSAGRRLLQGYLADEAAVAAQLAVLGPTATFRLDVRRTMARLCLAVSGNDRAATFESIAADDSLGVRLLRLAVRGGCYEGRALPPVSVADFLGDSDVAASHAELLDNTVSSLPVIVHVIRHSANSLAQSLAARRAYMSMTHRFDAEPVAAEAHFDPRFLVFEFVASFLLRPRQVELVTEFIQSVDRGESRVAQMIMGAGKTTVVGPLLAIMLGDGKRLVVQVMPAALLDMSRSVYRGIFSNVLLRRVLTFKFDRASPVGRDPAFAPRLLRQLEEARAAGSVVCADPSSVKALQLRYLDLLAMVRSAPLALCVPASRLGAQLGKCQTLANSFMAADAEADVLADILRVFRGGVVLLDEVDLLLHPMRSELNFPVGPKLALDFGPHRWALPMFLLDLVFFATGGKAGLSDFRADEAGVAALRDFREVVQLGLRHTALQPSPHPTLLRPEFYSARMRPIVARWAMVYLRSFPPLQDRLSQLASSSAAESKADAPDADAFVLLEAYISNAPPERLGSARELVHRLGGDAAAVANLAQQWVGNFFPHVLSKVNRVHYGLLHPGDFQRWAAEEGAPPLVAPSRRLLAVPFVGKDVPSRSSEFAHPEVLIGLSVLSYRYEGLRTADMVKVVKTLKDALNNQKGPLAERPARVQFQQWLDDAMLLQRASGAKSAEDDDEEDFEVLPLELFQVEDDTQVAALMGLLQRSPKVINHFLLHHAFPKTLRHQVLKLTASGVDLGSEMLFPTRIGFSGTPSDLLPKALGRCHFEPGSEAAMVRMLVSPEIVTYETLARDWDVTSLLRSVAESRQYSALIDTGALITGLSNEQVARELLRLGLQHKDAVVYLNDDGQKMVLSRMGGGPIPLSRAGVSLERRFTFYDQVHTTGMDIKQPLDATAALTLGKDMVARDYAQGAFRMRGLGRGQTIHLLVVEQVRNLISRVSNTGDLRVDGLAWLVVNGIRAEKLQHVALLQQELAGVWRREGFVTLLASKASSHGGGMPDKGAVLATRFHGFIADRERQDAALLQSNLLSPQERMEVLAADEEQRGLGAKYRHIRRQLTIQVEAAQLPATRLDAGGEGPLVSLEEAIDRMIALAQGMDIEVDLEAPTPAEEKALQAEIDVIKAKFEASLGRETLADILVAAPTPTARARLQHLRQTAATFGIELDPPAPPPEPPIELAGGASAGDRADAAAETASAPGAGLADGTPPGTRVLNGDDTGILPGFMPGASGPSAFRAAGAAGAAETHGGTGQSAAEAFAEVQASVQAQKSGGNASTTPMHESDASDVDAVGKSLGALQVAEDPPSQTRLLACVNLFLDPLVHDIPRTVPVPMPFSQSLAVSVETHREFLATSPELLAEADGMLAARRAAEAAHPDPGDASGEISLGAEIVQEQEAEQEAQKEKDVQKEKELQYAKGTSVLPSWRLPQLNASSALLGSGAFYPLSAFAPSPSVAPLPFPSVYLLSERHAPQLHAETLPRRLANVETLLIWRPAQHEPQPATTYLVALSLAESETLRRQLLQRHRFLPYVDAGTVAAIVTTSGTFLTPPPPDLGAAPAAGCAPAAPLRFFNTQFWFQDKDLIAILAALRTAPESTRKAFFEAALSSRRRDRASWDGTPVSAVFRHADDATVRRVYELGQRARQAIGGLGTGVTDVFKAWDTNADGFVNRGELGAGLERVGMALDAREVDELLRHGDTDADGFLDYREFASMFGEPEESGSAAVARAARILRRHRKGGAGVLEGLKGLVDLQKAQDVDETPAGLPLNPSKATSILDWRRLASVGRPFLTSGGHLEGASDGRLRTRAGYRPTVTPRGVALREGKWFFEVTAVRAGRGAAGWADPLFAPSQACGVGDDDNSWGYDCFAGCLRHGSAAPESYGVRWEAGDVLGCALDLAIGDMEFFLNGQGLGVAFAGVRPSGGLLFPALSFESSSELEVNFGEKPFRFAPARERGFRSVMHWVRTLQEQHHIAAAGTRYGTLQCTSGSTSLRIEGLKLTVDGGFPSATLAGCLLTHGKWYYEFTVLRPGVAQIGWADLDFVGSNRAGLGVGDDKHSWGYDGARAPSSGLWFNGRNTFGQPWTAGAVIGCAVDVDFRVMRFSHDGSFAPPMGVPKPAGLNFEFVAGLIPAFTLNPSSVVANFGAKPFRFPPPPGHEAIQTWIEAHRPATLTAVPAPANGDGEDEEAADDAEPPMVPSLGKGISHFGPLPRDRRSSISFRAASGFEVGVVEPQPPGGVRLEATDRYPTFLADAELTEGRYFFEALVVPKVGKGASKEAGMHDFLDPPASSAGSALGAEVTAVGFADKMHFGDSARRAGAGDDQHSFALVLSGKRGRLKHDGQERELGAAEEKSSTSATVVTCAVDCAKREIFFAINGEWASSAAYVASSAVGFFTPVVSTTPGFEVVVCVSARRQDYSQTGPDPSFLPIGAALQASMAPQFPGSPLAAAREESSIPAEATAKATEMPHAPSAALVQEVENLRDQGVKVLGMLDAEPVPLPALREEVQAMVDEVLHFQENQTDLEPDA